MSLAEFWFIIIGVLWIGYFVLEGFDFGVGILLPFLGHNEPERRAMLRTIGPVWDGNEVWLLTGAGAIFAAFPMVYAMTFSGFYLALFLILVALIVLVAAGAVSPWDAPRPEPASAPPPHAGKLRLKIIPPVFPHYGKKFSTVWKNPAASRSMKKDAPGGVLSVDWQPELTSGSGRRPCWPPPSCGCRRAS